MKQDLYLKVVLTVIAVALALMALNPWIAPRPAVAQSSNPVAVNYISPQAVGDLVQGLNTHGGLPVKILSK
ncbi:MAG: hypothetical protein V2A78_09435 [bacterium]